MCLDSDVTNYISGLGLTKSPHIRYDMLVDGLAIRQFMLPAMTQPQRDEVKGLIARDYSIPRKYFRLQYKEAVMEDAGPDMVKSANGGWVKRVQC